MKRFLRSKLFLTLAALVMIAAGIVVPLSGHIPHSHATAPSSPSIIATIPVSNEPTGIAVNPNINRIYVGHGGSEIAVIDGVKDTLLTTITTGNNHINMAVNPI